MMAAPMDSHFTTLRVPSPLPRSSQIRANQSSKLDPSVPRSFDLRFPPAPSVEDEEESLAKEHVGSVSVASKEEEPKYRGDVEQHPIILPVPEHNSERRFVLVKNPDHDADDDEHCAAARLDPGTPGATKPGEYEANTCRKYTLPRADEPNSPRPGDIKRRRSRLDLPRIETDVGHPPQSQPLPPPPSGPGPQRARSASNVQQRYYDESDRRGHHHQHRPSADGLLSPDTPAIIKASAGGRDRAYFDYSRSGNGKSPGTRYSETRVASSDRRQSSRTERPSLSVNPTAHKRSSSDVGIPKSPRRTSEKCAYRDEPPPSPRPARRHEPPPPSLGNRKSSEADRRSSPPSRERDRERERDRDRDRDREREREPLSRRRSSHRSKRESTTRRDSAGSGDEQQKSSSHRHRRKSTLTEDDRPGVLLSPDSAKPPRLCRSKSGARAAAAAAPASPRIFQGPFAEDDRPHTPLSASIYAQPRESKWRDERPVSPNSSGPSPPRSRSRMREDDQQLKAPPRPRSRPGSIIMGEGVVALVPALIPTPSASPPNSPVIERRPSPMPPHPAAVSRQNSVDSSSPTFVVGHMPPPPLNGNGNGPGPGPGPGLPTTRTYRQYLEDVMHGLTAALPPCNREKSQSGFNDWLTIPRRDNFHVCPDCYAAVFANTAFRNQLVPAQSRPRDKIACDFGATPWYRIAWFLTERYHLPDLRLLKAVADGLDMHRPCAGDRKACRTWNGVRDPYRQGFVPQFQVCAGCVRALEALLPNIGQVFQPMMMMTAAGSAAANNPRGGGSDAAKAVCSLHYSLERKRFLDYFEMFESLSDEAAATKSAPNIELLAHRLHRLSTVEECTKDRITDDKTWHFMRDIPNLTVCHECFSEVVFPEINRGSAVASNFFRQPQYLARAACQLYSPRMRGIFQKACQTGDMAFLEEKVLERQRIGSDIHMRLQAYEDMDGNEVDGNEVKRLVREWQKWE